MHIVSRFNGTMSVSGLIKVALHDTRKESVRPTVRRWSFWWATISEAVSMFFHQVWRTGTAASKGPMHIIYVTSGTYNLDDEVRLPAR